MSLFVRVNTSFYGHIKTIKLRARLGNDAFWIPPRIWAIAAEQRADGVFDGVSAEEFALLIGYNGDAPSMLQALLQAGFMDENPLRIHDWNDHNGYHASFAERASKAAKARWNKKTVKGEERRREETSNATSMLQASLSKNELASEIYDLYPRKVNREDAIRAIVKALGRKDSKFLRERTSLFAQKINGADRQYVPYPASWFNSGGYDSDPAEWELIGRNHEPKESISSLRVRIEAKKNRLTELKRKHFSDTQSIIAGQYVAPGWRNNEAKSEYHKLASEIKELEQKITTLA